MFHGCPSDKAKLFSAFHSLENRTQHWFWENKHILIEFFKKATAVIFLLKANYVFGLLACLTTLFVHSFFFFLQNLKHSFCLILNAFSFLHFFLQTEHTDYNYYLPRSIMNITHMLF